MSSQSAEQSSPHIAAAAARNSAATAHEAEEVATEAAGVSGAFTYGYDSAGNPTLADAGYSGSADRNPPP